MADRFWAKVAKADGCWLWTASENGRGYGQFWDGARLTLAHRYSYEMARGPIPDGLHIDHLCRTPRCVNPDHLEAVTCRENLIRGVGFIAKQAAQTECVRGHPLSGDNLGTDRRGRRRCKACSALHEAARGPRAPKGTERARLDDAA